MSKAKDQAATSLYQNLRPMSPCLGLPGTGGPITGRKGGPSMHAGERTALEMSGAPMPNLFTGKWKSTQYYKGRKWDGPANMVGSKLYQAPAQEVTNG
jgi:hypothetical protein